MNATSVLQITKHAISNKVHKYFALSQLHFYSISSEFESPRSKLPLTSLQCGAILQCLTNSKSFKQGQMLHGYIITSGTIQDNTYLSTKLAAFYASFGHMDKAQIIFDKIVLKSSFLWNFMIRGYATYDFPVDALWVYKKMMSFGVKTDKFTYPFVVKACGDLLNVEIGRKVHAHVVINGFESDVYVGNCLLSMYIKYGDFKNARLVFDKMPKRDLTSWNTMISGYAKSGLTKEALGVFQEMQILGVLPDSTTFLGLLSAISDVYLLQQCKEVHGYVLRNDIYCPNNFLTNSLIEFYFSCKALCHGKRLFEISRKDSVSWNVVISGFARSDEGMEGLRLFCQMVAVGKQPDLATFIAVLEACEKVVSLDFGMTVHSYLLRKGFASNTMAATALMSLYSCCGELSCSEHVFEEIDVKNLISWTAMISAYGRHGKGRDALSIWQQMVDNGICLDEGAFSSILTACSHSGLVDEGRGIFHQMQQKYNMKPVLSQYACFVDLLSRAGKLEEAYQIICNMVIRPTVDMWASLLSGCRLYGDVTLAEVAGQKILEGNPDGVGGYICLSHIYADEERWIDVEKLRATLDSERQDKPVGHSFVK